MVIVVWLFLVFTSLVHAMESPVLPSASKKQKTIAHHDNVRVDYKELLTNNPSARQQFFNELDGRIADFPNEMKDYIAEYLVHASDMPYPHHIMKRLVSRALQLSEFTFDCSSKWAWLFIQPDYNVIKVHDDGKRTIVCANPSFSDSDEYEIFDEKTGQSEGFKKGDAHIIGNGEILDLFLHTSETGYHFDYDNHAYVIDAYVNMLQPSPFAIMKLYDTEGKLMGEMKQPIKHYQLFVGVYTNHDNNSYLLMSWWESLKKWDLVRAIRVHHALQKNNRAYQFEFLKLLTPYMTVQRKDRWGNLYHPKLILNANDHQLAIQTLYSFDPEIRTVLMSYIEIKEGWYEWAKNVITEYMG